MSIRNIETPEPIRSNQPHAGRWWALAALVVSGLVVAIDATVLVTALPTLASKLGATTTDLQWISAAYTLALGGLLLPAGVVGDHYGRKRFLLVGLALFGVASLVASQVTTASGLIAMRAVMGAGAALIVPLSFSILPSMFSEAERPRAVSAAAAGAFLGLPLGPIVAGFLLTHYAWGSIFLINVPVTALALLGVWFFVPEGRDPEARRLDWVGALLAVVGVTALVYGVIEQPLKGWGNTQVLAGIIGGLIVIALFIAWDVREKIPFIDLRLFLDRRFTWATVAFVVVGFGLFGVLFILTPFLQIVQGSDAQATGLKLLPMIGGVIAGAVAGSPVGARLGARVAIPVGMLLSTLGLAILTQVGADTGYGLVAAGLAVVGFGMGIAFPTALDTILGALPPGQTGTGSALTRALQQIAATFGVAVLGSLLNTTYQSSLASHLAALPAGLASIANGNIAGAHAVAGHLPTPVGAPLVRAANVAYAQGMSEVVIVCAILIGAGAILIAAFMPSRTRTQ